MESKTLTAQDKLERAVIDTYLDFRTLLEYVGLSDFPCGENTPVFCPFHENTDTRAAHLYVEPMDADFGSCVSRERIYCFAETKMFYPHDVIERLDFPHTRNQVFSAVWNLLTEEQRLLFDNYVPVKSLRRDFTTVYTNYRDCKISFEELITALKITEQEKDDT